MKNFTDPTNVSCERSFGILKFIEKKFERMSLSNLLNTTTAKFNLLDEFIADCDKKILIDAHKSQNKSAAIGREEDYKNKIIKIQKKIGRNMKKNDLTDRIQIASCLIETNPNELIPRSMKDISKKYSNFKKECKATSTSVLGPRQYRTALLLTVRHLLKIAVPQIINDQDFEFADSASKAEVDQKTTRALFLYDTFEAQIRSNILF